MDLTPESREIGKENFRAAIGSSLIRRSFLQDGIKKGVRSGGGLGPHYYGYAESIERPLRVGVIGTGDEGSVLIGALNPRFVEVTAIADIRPYNQWRALHGDHYSPAALAVRCGLMAKYVWKTEDEAKKHVKIFGPYQELLEEADVEAVIIALPLHLHAAAAIAAMKAGKHVLTEKLMGHSVAQCKEMARVAKATGKHLATGHQRHYNILYDNAVHAINQGVLGDLHYIRAQWHRGNLPGKDSWQQPMPRAFKPDDLHAATIEKELAAWEKNLAGLEKNLAAAEKKKDAKRIAELGPQVSHWAIRVEQKKAQLADKLIVDQLEKLGYESRQIKDQQGRVLYNRPAGEELIRWRLWDRTGGGLMAELGSHQLDAASIFIAAMHEGKKQYPLSVSAAANRPIFPPDRDVDDHVFCMFEFPAANYDPGDELLKRKKITVSYASINGNGFGGYGETVFGTQGTLLLETEKEALLFQTHNITEKTVVKGSIGQAKLEILAPGDNAATEERDLSAAIGFHATAGDISRGYTEQIEHWAACIRENPEARDDGPLPHCHPRIALGDAVIALTTNLAARGPGRIEFKREWFDPESDETPEGVKPDVSKYS